MTSKLSQYLQRIAKMLHPMFIPTPNPANTIYMDFSASNPGMHELDFSDTGELNRYVFRQISKADALYGFGGYLEDRAVYRRSPHFSRGEGPSRSIHLGVDLWAREGTRVYLPLDGLVHSFQVNETYGDYGPTIIVEHSVGGLVFFTLYGHLSLQSLDGLYPGKTLKAGDAFCQIGDFPVNGDWPPHLHFQVIADMMGMKGDFPGVCLPEEVETYREICPDPIVFFQELNP
jgi:peptidoglycan LD-endopeptidase LytH